MRQSGAAGAWWLAAGGGDLLGVRSRGTTSGAPDTKQRAGPGRRPGRRFPNASPPHLQINHVGLFDDPSVTHAKGGDFFAAKPRGGREKISLLSRKGHER